MTLGCPGQTTLFLMARPREPPTAHWEGAQLVLQSLSRSILSHQVAFPGSSSHCTCPRINANTSKSEEGMILCWAQGRACSRSSFHARYGRFRNSRRFHFRLSVSFSHLLNPQGEIYSEHYCNYQEYNCSSEGYSIHTRQLNRFPEPL